MDIHQRLEIFYERLRSAPPATNAEEAFDLIGRTLEQVENEFCEVPPRVPAPKHFHGRMYLPQKDHIIKRADLTWIKTRRHRIAIKGDGSFVIYRKLPNSPLMEQFRKSGAIL